MSQQQEKAKGAPLVIGNVDDDTDYYPRVEDVLKNDISDKQLGVLICFDLEALNIKIRTAKQSVSTLFFTTAPRLIQRTWHRLSAMRQKAIGKPASPPIPDIPVGIAFISAAQKVLKKQQKPVAPQTEKVGKHIPATKKHLLGSLWEKRWNPLEKISSLMPANIAFQGAAFGAFLAVLGIFSADLLNARSSLAASVPVGEADSVIYLNPTPAPYATGVCATYECGGALPVVQPVAAAPIMISVPLIVVTTTQEVRTTVKKTATKSKARHVKRAVKRKASQNICVPVKKAKRVVKRVKRVKHVQPAAQVVEKTYITQQPVYLYSAPVVIPIVGYTPPVVAPQPQPNNPCMNGACDIPCEDYSSRLDIKGPCGDPNTPCIQRVSFDSSGFATKVVLEPGGGNATKPHFETPVRKVVVYPYWMKPTREDMLASNTSLNEHKVSLVLPFANPAYGSQPIQHPSPTT